MRTIYAVMELVGNFAHTLDEFDDYNEAEHFMIDMAAKDAVDEFTCEQADVPDTEWIMALENALSCYSIDKWEV